MEDKNSSKIIPCDLDKTGRIGNEFFDILNREKPNNVELKIIISMINSTIQKLEDIDFNKSFYPVREIVERGNLKNEI